MSKLNVSNLQLQFQKIKELYREEDEAEPRNQALTCYEFAKDISIGDFIYIKK